MPRVIRVKLEEILFRARNQAYGAYVLRKQVLRNTTLASLIVFLASFGLLAGPLILKALRSGELDLENLDPPKGDIVSLEEVEPVAATEPDPDSLRELSPPPPPRRSTSRHITPRLVTAEDATPDVTINRPDSMTQRISSADTTNEAADEPVIGPIDANSGEPKKPAELAGPPSSSASRPADSAAAKDEKLTRAAQPVNLDRIKQAIRYPESMRMQGITGQVILQVLFDKQGRYQKHKVLRSPHPAFTRACEKKVERLRVVPAIRGTTPVAAWVRIPINFRLN